MASIEEMKKVASGKHVLLIEDNEVNAMITSRQLKGIGYEVEWVLDGAQGVNAFLASQTNHYSCIITDLMMPIMDGNETAKKIRKSGREDSKIPIMAVTANAYVMQAKAEHDNAIDKFLIKPYDKQVLLDWVHEKVCEFEEINGTVSKAK